MPAAGVRLAVLALETAGIIQEFTRAAAGIRMYLAVFTPQLSANELPVNSREYLRNQQQGAFCTLAPMSASLCALEAEIT